MIKCLYRKKGLKLEHIWFDQSDTIASKADIVYLHGITNKQNYKNATVQFSMLTDVTQDEDAIFNAIKKNYKYEIRRAERENVEIKTYCSKEIQNNPQILDLFEETYNEMYRSKGLQTSFNRNLVCKYIDSNAIMFTVAFLEDKPFVFHSYLYDETICRLYQSASCFRTEKGVAVLIGRMNKALHWYDIKLFKSMGIKVYDWGGISNPDEPNGIDEFKMSYPGEIVSYKNVLVPNTIKGKIVCMLMRIKSSLKKQ